ncbi:glyoxalase-like domain-containing protein [Flagelloscypha sp. PMI_526]|nr:glyoxalase-like domain-containing protein [Flagelloscypha sp. PMI_526]
MSSSTISTHILDHIVHLVPPNTLGTTAKEWADLGFIVSPGGTHADGLTSNLLVLLADGVYLELISFNKQPSPPTHRWGNESPGWIDFAFLGTGSTDPSQSISKIINERSNSLGGPPLYEDEVKGGRTREDNVILKWLISAPKRDVAPVGRLPFFCGDVTERHLRVPTNKENSTHASTTRGIAWIRLGVFPTSFKSTVVQLTSVVGYGPISESRIKAQWKLDTPQGNETEPALILEATEEKAGIQEVAFFVDSEQNVGEKNTPYGLIRWVLYSTTA